MKHGPYTTGEVAKILECSANTIVRVLERGELKSYKVPGSNHRRVSHRELVAYMVANELKFNQLDAFNAAG